MASGTVYARVVLPKGMDVNLDVNRVLPDVLIFDGEVPLLFLDRRDEEDGNPAPPLPDPLPERAFARIRPDKWLDSLSKADEAPSQEGSVYTVTADLVDVPLQVLPGREKAFSTFVGKVCNCCCCFNLLFVNHTLVGCFWDTWCSRRFTWQGCCDDRRRRFT